jgi:hypothetical protein
MAFAILVVALFCIYPNVNTAIAMSQPNQNQISKGWQETCTWLRTCTVEPSSYYDLKAKPTYGVMSWWDYGYWITREGERPAMCNPGSNIRYEVAQYLLSPEYKVTHDKLVEKNIQYIIIDYLMVTSKFYAIDTLAHAPMGEQYLPTKYQQDYIYWNEDQQQQVMLNYEEYYLSLVARLYNFDGKPVRSPGTPVFQADKDRTIKSIKDLPTLEEALIYQKENGGFIAGSDPFLSPYPMNDSLESYFKLVWTSNNKVKIGNWIFPEVKVFEVVQ